MICRVLRRGKLFERRFYRHSLEFCCFPRLDHVLCQSHLLVYNSLEPSELWLWAASYLGTKFRPTAEVPFPVRIPHSGNVFPRPAQASRHPNRGGFRAVRQASADPTISITPQTSCQRWLIRGCDNLDRAGTKYTNTVGSAIRAPDFDKFLCS
jgi:hypothetical protein